MHKTQKKYTKDPILRDTYKEGSHGRAKTDVQRWQTPKIRVGDPPVSQPLKGGGRGAAKGLADPLG
jgi:hypothetical protein